MTEIMPLADCARLWHFEFVVWWKGLLGCGRQSGDGERLRRRWDGVLGGSGVQLG